MNIIRFCVQTKIYLSEMLPINQIILHFIDWTDYRRLMPGQSENCTSLHYTMVKSIAEYALENHSGTAIYIYLSIGTKVSLWMFD